MNKGEKIQILKNLQAGAITINALKSRSAVVIKKENKYHITGTNLCLSEQEFKDYIKGMSSVLMLPDNGRSPDISVAF